MKRKWSYLAIASTIALSLSATACGNGDGSGNGQVTLRFAINSADDKTLVNAVNEFQKENPSIKVELEPIPWTQFFDKVETQIAGGRAPDVIDTPALATGRYQQLGLLLDLTPYVSKDDLKDFVPVPLSTVQFDGKLYGLPLDMDGIGVYYNKTLFDKAGVKVPTSLDDNWNWDQFIEAAKKVKEANHLQYGLAIGNDVSQWLPFLYANQGTVLNSTQTAAGINTPEGVEAISFFNSWFKNGLAPKDIFISQTPNAVDQLFAQGKLPLAIDFSGDVKIIQSLVQGRFEWGETYLPKQKVFGNKLGGWNLLAFKSTKHPAEAAKLIKFLTSKEQMIKYCTASTEIPTRFSAQKEIDYGPVTKDMQVVIEELNNTPEFAIKDFATPKYLAYKKILTSAMQSVVLGKLTPEQAAKTIEDEINKSIF